MPGTAARPAVRGDSIVPKIFLTGDPGCGKTTAIRRVIEALSGIVAMTGFVTEDVRDGEKRTGFRGATLDGRVFPLARLDTGGTHRVGPYRVTLEGLEAVGVPALVASPTTELVVLDEVGKMESFSEAFRRSVEDLIEGDIPVLGTVAAHGVGFVKRVRHDPRVTILKMTRDSRGAVVGEILRRLGAAGIGPGTGTARRGGAAGPLEGAAR